MTTLQLYRGLLARCLAARLPACLRADVLAALSTMPGRPRAVDDIEVNRLRLTMTDVAIAAHLGVGTATITRVKKRIELKPSKGIENVGA